jgi:hypothetical protein
MESIPDMLKYLLFSAGATVSGILYWMSIENMKSSSHKLFYVFLLSLFLTPAGAWVVTTILRITKISTST